VWDQYQQKRAEKKKEKGRLREEARNSKKKEGEDAFSDDDVPDDLGYVYGVELLVYAALSY